MGNVLVVYDSVFGNTEKVAQAIGSALEVSGTVTVVKAADVVADHWRDIEVLVIGSPTRGFRPTPAVVQLLKSQPAGQLSRVKAAAFDTRIMPEDINSKFLRFVVNIAGYAAPVIAKQLKKKGADLVLPPEGYFVNGSEGPLKDGELVRAAEWVQHLVSGSV
jgi:flavodoxin